jgi:hypothetical protein
MENYAFRKTMDFDMQITYQSHYFYETWNDPTVITVILPQPV